MTYQIVCYVPKKHAELVKEAMFAAGAGRIGNYHRCAWQTLGQGQFEPLPGSQPYLGIQNQLEKLEEYKVEMVCHKQAINAVIDALKQTHPYEQPAYSVYTMEVF